MASKSSSPGPNVTSPSSVKQARSRKAATQSGDAELDAGRAGSAGGIVLEKKNEAEKKSQSSTSRSAHPSVSNSTNEGATKTANNTRRKPRKLNKAPTSTNLPPQTTVTTDPVANEVAAATELEALKSRVRGLEAKVEELYKNGTLERPGRSPRRRGKGRKGSSSQKVPTLATTKSSPKVEEVFEDADEELVRLEGELEVARQDLAQYRPRTRLSKSDQTYIEDDVEEIPRDAPAADNSSNRHVTLSGSYRIPLPASVNTEDLKTIQSGVSAAQNVARSFLEQRRAAAALREQQDPTTTTSSSAASQSRPRPRPVPKSVSSSLEVVKDDGADGKQSWSEWIGGYSMAISRAVKNIEHEAAVESQPVGAGGSASGGARKTTTKSGKRPGNKRLPSKAKVSSEQVEGLMS